MKTIFRVTFALTIAVSILPQSTLAQGWTSEDTYSRSELFQGPMPQNQTPVNVNNSDSSSTYTSSEYVSNSVSDPVSSSSSYSLPTAEAHKGQPWTLDECIDYALEHNITVRNRALNVRSGEYAVTEAKDRFLPSVSASANESFAFGRGLTSQNTYANRNTQNFGWNVNLNLPLFQGLSAVRQLDYAKANLQQLLQEWESAKDDITLNVIAQYLQVLACQELHNVAQIQYNLSVVQLDRQRQLLDAGKVPQLDVIEAESQLAQNQVTLVTSENDYKLALLDLAQLLEIDAEGFQIRPLESSGLQLLSVDEVYNKALHNNHAILASRYSVTAAEKQVTVAKSGYIPTLSFYAGLGSSYYKVSGMQEANFSKQMRDNFSRSLGLSLSIPIFDAFNTRNSLRRAKVSLLSAELALEQAQNTLYKAIAQAYQQAVGAEEKLKSSTKAVEATKAAFEGMQDKYDYGKANATEYEQARAAYIRALAEQVSARYESALRTRILAFYNKD